ncbi:MAG: hypothetical protein RLZZ301_1225 [Bacteroidota bacterium]
MPEPRTTQRLKQVLFALAMGLLLFPWLEQNEHWLTLAPLGGAQQLAENPKFSINNWKKGSFQEGQEAYVRDHFGARPFFIRFYNELNDRLFGEFKANGVIRGKDGYLFEENYLLAASGNDFLGQDSIRLLVGQLQALHLELAAQHKHLLVCLAPGKATFFPDKIPAPYRWEAQQRNHPYFVKAIQQAGIELFDIQRWFLSQKSTARYPLFPKNGIHWSSYGEYLVADSLIKRTNALAHFPYPSLSLTRIDKSKQMRERDEDIELGMNLLRNLPDWEMGYPQFKITKRTQAKGPRVLVIGDSFFYGMYNWGMTRDVFAGGQFWYYNNEILEPGMPTKLVSDLPNYKAAVNQFDVVIVLLTDANLPRFGFGLLQNYQKP